MNAKDFYNMEVFRDVDLFWQGVRIQKNPMDLWLYQELIYATRPDVVIETGTLYGGSALYIANMMDMIGRGEVITVDIYERERPTHERIRYIVGDSTHENTFSWLSKLSTGKRVMCILDSEHETSHVLKELGMYSQLVTKGCYLIVEDTNLDVIDHETYGKRGPGRALNNWLPANKHFVRDFEIEKFHPLSFNPGGYLRRIK